VGSLHLVPLAQGLTDFEAKVLTAQLGAEGIIWQVRGVVDSVYPLGDIDVLVPLDELEAARPLLVSPRPSDDRSRATDPAESGSRLARYVANLGGSFVVRRRRPR
jgi:hypothetical protein